MAKSNDTPTAAPAAVASAPAAPAETTAPAGPRKFVPKVLKVITLPLIKLRPGSELFVQVVSPMFLADAIKNPKPLKEGETAQKPPMLVNVMDLETGEAAQIIPGQILQDIFTDKYPKETYVGKGFWIKVGEKKGGGGGRSGYNTYTVSEIEVPAKAA